MSKWIVFSAALLGWQLSAINCSLAQGIQTIALTGDPVPGMGATLEVMLPPAFNNHGQVAFVSTIAGTIPGEQAILFGDKTSLQTIAMSGLQAAGTPQGVSFNEFLSSFVDLAPQLNDGGEIAFNAHLKGSRGSEPINLNNRDGIWRWSAGNIQLLARAGDQVPNAQNGAQFSFEPLLANQNSAGEIAFYASESIGGLNSQGFWKTSSAVPHSVALTSQFSSEEIPGFPGYRFGVPLHSSKAIRLDDQGRLNFEANYLSDEGTGTGIWREENGQFELFVHTGQAAAGEHGDVTFTQTSHVLFNELGQSVFRMQLAGAQVTDANSAGIWLFNGTQLEKIVRTGDPVLGLPTSTTFGWAIPTDLNDSGQAVFTADLLTNGSETAGASLWKYAAGNLELVTRVGDPAPGTEAGLTFASASFFDPQINAHNQAAFVGQVTGTGIDTSNDLGLWAQDLNGLLRLIVREGDQLEVRPGDFRTVSSLAHDVIPRNYSQTSYFNDKGQVVFVATFTDGSQGMFISNLVAIPEPSAMALALFGMTAVCCLRRT